MGGYCYRISIHVTSACSNMRKSFANNEHALCVWGCNRKMSFSVEMRSIWSECIEVVTMNIGWIINLKKQLLIDKLQE